MGVGRGKGGEGGGEGAVREGGGEGEWRARVRRDVYVRGDVVGGDPCVDIV